MFRKAFRHFMELALPNLVSEFVTFRYRCYSFYESLTFDANILYWSLKHINLMFRIWRRWRVMCFACMTPIQMVFRFWKTISTKIVFYCIHTLYFSILVRKHIIWVCKKCAKKCVNLRQNSKNRPNFRNLYATKYTSLKKYQPDCEFQGLSAWKSFSSSFTFFLMEPQRKTYRCVNMLVCVCVFATYQTRGKPTVLCICMCLSVCLCVCMSFFCNIPNISQKIFRIFDVNNDGTISETEMEKLVEDMKVLLGVG